MKITLDVDLTDAINDSIDPPQNEWSISEFEDDLIERLKEYILDLERDTGSIIRIKNEEGKTIY